MTVSVLGKHGRRTGSALVMAVVALAGLVIGHMVVAARDSWDGDVPRVTVAQLLADPDHYRGRQVALVLAEGKRTEGDPVAPLITRSDIHLHDETGSVMLTGGWQDWNRWRTGGEKLYVAGALEIDEAGTWTIRAAAVSYTDAGMPYLAVAR